MAEFILGIDGGGSKTRALLADRAGVVLGSGTAGSSNYQSAGFAVATGSLQAAIADALQQAGCNADSAAGSIVAACFGLSGVDRPDDQLLFDRWLQAHPLAQRWSIVNDAELVLAAGTPDGWGAALICGTGSICYGRAPDGRTARAGGWGYLLGDEGSGYDIGVQALRLATQTADGRADAHALLAMVLEEWQLDEPFALIGYIYRPDLPRATIAALARRVAALAERGDPHAQAIFAQAGRELGRLVTAVAQRLHLDHPPLALGGGLLGAQRSLQAAVQHSAEVPLGPLRYVSDPAQGALVLARRLLADY